MFKFVCPIFLDFQGLHLRTCALGESENEDADFSKPGRKREDAEEKIRD
jgi:hypothetical protein